MQTYIHTCVHAQVKIGGQASMKLTAQLPTVAGLYTVNYKTLSDDPESNIPLGAVMSDNERIVQVRSYLENCQRTETKHAPHTRSRVHYASYLHTHEQIGNKIHAPFSDLCVCVCVLF
jgi:hypothetical protein